MSIFIKKLLFFSLIIGILSFSGDYIISQGLRTSGLRAFCVWSDIYNGDIDADAVILGNSRAWSQYNPHILDSIVGLNFYNLGIDAHGIIYHIIRYKTLIRYNPKPKYIIQNVDFITFRVNESGYEREQFFPYFFDDTLISMVAIDKKYSFVDRKIPIVRYFGYRSAIYIGFRSFFGYRDFSDGNLYKGFRANNNYWDGNKLNEIQPNQSFGLEKADEAFIIFESFLKECRKENIKVVMVQSPIYIEAKNKVKEIDKTSEKLAYLALKYNIEFIDYTNDSICSDTSYFKNAIHLNKKGSKLFSEKLACDLKDIIFIE